MNKSLFLICMFVIPVYASEPTLAEHLQAENTKAISEILSISQSEFKTADQIKQYATTSGFQFDTPLHFAARYGHVDLAQFAIKYRCRNFRCLFDQDMLNLQDDLGKPLELLNAEKKTPLQVAELYGFK